MVLVPPVLSALLDLVQKPKDVQLDQHLRAAMRASGQHLARMALGLAWLPHETFSHLDAIWRTTWRIVVSGRHLLQWQTSSEVAQRDGNAAVAFWRTMWVGPLLARGADRGAGDRTAAGAGGCRAAAAAVAGIAGGGLVDQPAARGHALPAQRGAVAVPAHAGASHLGLLRRLYRPRRPLAAAGQPAGGARARAGSSHLADQHRPGAAGQPGGL